VLTRTNAQSRTFEEAFIAHGIGYQMVGQTRYYDRKEIKDMLSYMAVIQNPADDLALLRIINEPKRGIGAKSVEALLEAASARGISLLDMMADEKAETLYSGAKARFSAAGLVALVSGFSAEYSEMKVSELYDLLLEKTGYLRALEERNTVEDDGRVENLLEFRSAILESEEEDPALDLAGFLERIALMSDIDNHNRDADAIAMMTMHAAKGLEFPVVFLPGMEEGLFPTQRSMDSPEGIEEERRLCYVGMTRAMEKLYLLRAQTRTLYGKRDYTIESRFLREIEPGVLDENGARPGGQISGWVHGDIWGEGWRNRAGTVAPDPRRRAREEIVAKAATPEYCDVKTGDLVRHRKFGNGLVLEAGGGYATVLFDDAGKKKLALGIAPLEKRLR